MGRSFGGAVKRLERERGRDFGAIVAEAVAAEGSVRGAALALGVNYRSLYRWLRAAGLETRTRVTTELVESVA